MSIEMSTVGKKLKQAFSTEDISSIVDLAPEPGDYKTHGVHVVTIAMAVMECIVKRRRNDWLNEALVCIMHVHASLPDISDYWNKLYVDLLVDIKVKAVMHRLFSRDPDECDTIDMEAIVHSYFDPTLFSGIEPSQTNPPGDEAKKVEYTDKHSYSGTMHRMAYDGISGMMKSRENVDQMRKFFTNDMSRFEERLKKLLRSYFQLARNHIRPQVKEEVTDEHQPGKDAPEQPTEKTITEVESYQPGKNAPEQPTEKSITEFESSFKDLCGLRSKRTCSMVARTKILCTFESESDQVSSSSDEPNCEFNFHLPDALLQSTASQQPSQHTSNTQTCDQIGAEISKTKAVPKFFYESSTQSQEMSSQNIEPAKPLKQTQTARKRTNPLSRVTEPAKLLKSKQTARKFIRPRRVSPVEEGYKIGVDLRNRPVYTRTLRPRRTARKHTRPREVSPSDDLDEKSVSYHPAKRRRDRSPTHTQPETVEKNFPMSKNNSETASDSPSDHSSSPSKNNIFTQIIDVGGPEDVLYLSDVESPLEDDLYKPEATKHSKHTQSGHSNVDKTAEPQTPSPRMTYVKPRSPFLQEPTGSKSTSSEEIRETSGLSNLFSALRNVIKRSNTKVNKTGRNTNTNNTHYMSPEIPLLNPTSFLTSRSTSSDVQSDSH